MKKLLLLMTVASLGAAAQKHTIEKLWETDTVIAVPESVLPDFKTNILYVSLIDGGAWTADGKGGIAKLAMNGKVIDPYWIKGLNAPKGLGIYENRLYVADIGEVAVIDIQKGTIEKRIPVAGAKALNDLTLDHNGIVYVSDSRTGQLYKIEKDQPSLFLDSLPGINGIKCIGDDLYILSGKSFLKCDQSKKRTSLATLDQSGDGLEPVGNGDFIATSWTGYMYYVHANGSTELLLDTHLANINTADIGYNMSKRIIYVPTFNAKTVIAYHLK